MGANVTLPHKEAALRAARSTDAAAIAMGAANTLWLDAEGVASCGQYRRLRLHDQSRRRKRRNGTRGSGAVLVLGAGGAARAILYGLLAAGVPKILLANRTRARADSLAKLFGPKVEAIDWEEREPALAGCSLLVNTTSLGMTGQAPLDIDLSALPRTLSSPTSSTIRWRRTSWRPRGPGASRPWTGSACCCTRRCLGSSAGSACGPR